MPGRECYHRKQWIEEGEFHERKSKTKMANLLKITHLDQVEPPVTDWLREAYELSAARAARRG